MKRKALRYADMFMPVGRPQDPVYTFPIGGVARGFGTFFERTLTEAWNCTVRSLDQESESKTFTSLPILSP